ncbi:hypothetical protein CBR_g34915 [Chara braunii]|uniref:DUF659 domain-containing protein n=1 Tax=Chara braunii TaxID=69332 RepID=A0A388LJP6_CHABU|nr:hypothetical protein CBR_g34915 [Chara braunii]|eukprot:GBG82539.1 hypothetical protein CBR_g34915 [Chara braunii]
MMLCCTFCNKVFQGTQFQATRHFSQTNYCKDVSDEALYEIARRTQQKFEADQMERVARYAVEHGLDVPDTGGARGGEAGQRPTEGGVGGDGGHGAADPTLGGGGGETEEGVIHVDREARGPGEEGVPEREDVPKFYPGTGGRLEDWRRRAGKRAATEGSSKRKEGGSDPAATPAGKRLRHGVSFNAFRNQAWKAYQHVLLKQPGSSARAVLPNHYKIASMGAVETHRVELAEELEEVRQPFRVTGATLLSDGRKSRDGRPIVNFLAAGSRGVVVYTTINREGEANDAVHVLQRWVTIFHKFRFGRPQRINTICTDSASAYVEWYDAWLVGQTKRYILTQTGFELEGAEYILACRRFEDFHIQQGRFGDWGRPEGRARGRACSDDSETIECASWWSQFGTGVPELQRCALRVMHMWSCASPAERNWAVHEGIHTKKRNQLAFEKVVQLVEITANVRLTEYRQAGCSYVLPWQRDEGMLDCQAGLELEPVRSGTRRGMTEEEIVRQVALITRDPIGASAPPSADAVFDRRACIFRPYPREDDSDGEPIPEAADDPALCIPREIDEMHEDPDSEETRANTARRGADRVEREMLGGDEDFWGPFGEVASTGGPEAHATTPTPTRRDSSMPPPPAPSPAPPSLVSPLQPDREELGSSLPQRGLLHRGGTVRQLRLRSPSPGILQEEGAPSAAAVESSVTPAAVPDATISAALEEIAAAAVLEEMATSVLEEAPPVAGGGAVVEGPVAAAGGEGGGATAVEVEVAAAVEEEEAPLAAAVEEEIAAQAEAFARAVEEARRRKIRGGCVQGGVVAGEDVAEGVAAEPVPEAIPGGAEVADVVVEGRPQSVDEAMQAGQRRVEGAIDAQREVQETATGTVILFSGLHLAQARQPQPVQMAVHGVPPPVITDLGSEPVVVPPRLPSHFAPQEVRRPLDAEELAREAVRNVTRLDRRIFNRRLEHPPWQTIPLVPWGPASPVWSGSTSTKGHTAGHVPGISGGVTETAPHTGDMPPPPPRAPAGDPSSSPTGRGSRSPHTPGRSRIRDTTSVQQDVCDTTIFGRTYIDLDSTRRVTEHTARLELGLGGGGARTTMTKEVLASGCEPQRGRGKGVSTETLEYALRAATRAVQEKTPRKRGVPPRPPPVPAEGGAVLGESSRAEGLGMPRGSRREQTIAEASARVVVLRKGGGPITIEEDDPDTDASVGDADEDYEGEEGGEEDSRSGSDGDDDDDYDEPPPSPGPPPTHASRRSAPRTSSSS